MLFVVDQHNRAAYAEQLEELYRLRHRIYVEGRGWQALGRPDKREVDQFDTLDAVYLLGLDHQGHITSGLRLVPTLKPHLMRDVFPHIVTSGDIPCGPRIYEATRCFVVEEPGKQNIRDFSVGEVFCAAFEYGLAIGLTHISLVCDPFFLPKMRACSWTFEELGPPTPYAEGSCIAILIEVSKTALEGTRRVRGVRDSAAVYSPLPPPYASPTANLVAA